MNYIKPFHFFVLLSACFAFSPANAHAQEVDNTPYKIVIQLTSGDTAVHHSVVKQLRNILVAAPKSQIEVVCHNNGITFLQSSKTLQADKIREFSEKGVVFAACENTMRDRKIKREELVKECTTVPSGVVEIVKKQRKHWAYLKAG